MIKKIIKKTKLYKYFHSLGEKIQSIDQSSHEIKLKQDEVSNKSDLIIEKIANIEKSMNDMSFTIKNVNDELINLRQLYNSFQNKIADVNYYEKIIYERTKQLECINMELLMLNDRKEFIQVLIVGFYGAQNLGDELMLESILGKIGNKSNIRITIMIADNPKYDIRKYGNVNFIHYPKNNIDLHIIAKYFDKIIFGGGALIDDSKWGDFYSNNISLYNILINLSTFAINLNKDIYLVGLSSSAKINNQDYIRNLENVLNNARYVSLRDKNSLKVLRESGIKNENIEIIDDLIYGIPEQHVEVNKSDDEYVVGMVLVSYTSTEILLDIVRKTEKYLLKKTQNRKYIKLIPFYVFEDSDINKYKEIINSINIDESIEILIQPYVNTYNEIVQNFKYCDIIVAMRYHASLIALKEQIPAVHVIYDVHNHYINKMDDLLNKYDAKCNSILLSQYDGDRYFDILKNCKKNKKYIATTNYEDIFKDIYC